MPFSKKTSHDLARGWRPLALLGAMLVSACAVTPGTSDETLLLSGASQPLPAGHIDAYAEKPRVFVLSDIGNEPDDQMSLVRFLMYANEMNVEGLVATTSTWQRDKVQPDIIHRVLDAYGEVQANLALHDDDYPGVEALRAVVHEGPAVFGMDGLEGGAISHGARALISALEDDSDLPLWVLCWGGANALAEALIELRETRPADEVDELARRLRVYAISDQDDAGPWIRREFPQVFYVVSPSHPNSDSYGSATWTGIAGDEYYRNSAGADPTTVTNEWLDANIRRKGPLGAAYPEYMFMMEGDTPSFLWLIANGLESYRSPAWGGWGGRYAQLTPYGETRPIWTQGGDMFDRVASADAVVGLDGDVYVTDHATIWRWRNDFQTDFAARMDWTIKSVEDANHHPEVVVNGQGGTEAIVLDANVGDVIRLDASETFDPDRDDLTFEWFHYAEAGADADAALGDVVITGESAAIAEVDVAAISRPLWLVFPGMEPPSVGVAHIILKVTDNGAPAMSQYRRVVLNITD